MAIGGTMNSGLSSAGTLVHETAKQLSADAT
jgi:hypothetical protein